MIIGTALGFSDWGTVGLAVALAFVFGYGLTSLPLLRAGLALGAVIPIALASDTLSIAVMEIVDNAIILAVPGAMEAGLDACSSGAACRSPLSIAGVFAMPVNRWLIARGKGHAVVHETGHPRRPAGPGRGGRRRGRARCSAPPSSSPRSSADGHRERPHPRLHRRARTSSSKRLSRVEGQVRGVHAHGRGRPLLHRRPHPDRRRSGGAGQDRAGAARRPRAALPGRRGRGAGHPRRPGRTSSWARLGDCFGAERQLRRQQLPVPDAGAAAPDLAHPEDRDGVCPSRRGSR